MGYWLRRVVFVAIATVPATAISWRVRPLLGIAFLVTALNGLTINGLRLTVTSIPLRPADADDPASPPAISRALQNMIRGQTIFLGVMSLVYAIAAIWTADRPVRILATSFAVAALAAGPGTSVRRRTGFRVAAVSVVAGLLVLWLQEGRV